MFFLTDPHLELILGKLRLPILTIIFLFLLIYKIYKKKKDKDQQTLIESIVTFLYSIVAFTYSNFLSPYNKQISNLDWFDRSKPFLVLIVFGLTFYSGIKSILVFMRTKKLSFIIWGILCLSVSLFGIVLSLIEILQMFNVVS